MSLYKTRSARYLPCRIDSSTKNNVTPPQCHFPTLAFRSTEQAAEGTPPSGTPLAAHGRDGTAVQILGLSACKTLGSLSNGRPPASGVVLDTRATWWAPLVLVVAGSF